MFNFITRCCLGNRPIWCLALALLLVNVQPAGAQTAQGATLVMQAESDTNYVQGTNLLGLRANTLGVGVARATNFSVTAHNICRYIDVIGSKNVFVPFANNSIDKPEWRSFIKNVNKNDVSLDMCRMQHDFGSVEYAPGLSFNDPSYNAPIPGPSTISSFYTVPANMKGKLDAGVSTVYTVSPAPMRRVDTRSATAIKEFRDDHEDRPQTFTVSRQDCRHTTYPDGSTAEVCAPQSWVETITAVFRYVLNANGIAIADSEGTVINKLKPLLANPEISEVGSWSGQLVRTATIPAFTPVPNRSCVGRVHGEKYWVDDTWQQVAASCGAGYISDPSDPYQRRWQNERQYQCFDERTFDGSYPLPTIREKAGTEQFLGRCLPIIPGQCNAAYTSQQYLTLGSSPALCSVGAVASFQSQGDRWTYTCLGQNTGANANCTVLKIPGTNVWSWGKNNNGQLGDGFAGGTRVNTPVNVIGGNTYLQVSAGFGDPASSCAIKNDGTLWCWGSGFTNGTTQLVPVQIPGISGATSVAVYTNGRYCVTQNNGNVICSQTNGTNPMILPNANGAVLTGAGGTAVTNYTAGNILQVRTDVVPGADTWISNPGGSTAGRGAATGAGIPLDVCAVRSDGTAVCWNSTAAGPTGNVFETVTLPGNGWRDIKVGQDNTCALNRDGSLWCFGSISGNGGMIQIPGGNYMAVTEPVNGLIGAIKADGSVWVVGTQSGYNGSALVPQTPVKISGGGYYVAVAATNDQLCALTNAGAASCWNVSNGQIVGGMYDLPGGKTFATINAGSGHFTALEGTPAPMVCYQHTEERSTTPCPNGQTGVITERRTLNVGDVCNQNGNWTNYSNTCQWTYSWQPGDWVNGTCNGSSTPVPPPVVNGECGGATGVSTGTAPSGSGLCAQGTASGVSLDGNTNTWSWTCAGANSGNTPTCTAHRTTYNWSVGAWNYGSCH